MPLSSNTEQNHTPAPTGPIFFQRRFLPMWMALSFGTFADNTLRQALLIGIPAGIISVPFVNDADNAMPFIGALLPAAILIFSSVSGQLADKFETSLMFKRTKFIELLLMILAALAFASNTGWLAIAMLFAMGAQSAFFSPVRVSAMPKYLNADELVRGNGLCNAGLFGFILIGTMAGGILIDLNHGGAKVGAVLIMAACVGFTSALFTPHARANAPDLKLSFNSIAQTISMFRHVLASPGVAPPLFGGAVFYFLTTAVIVVIPLYGRDTLHASPLVWACLNGIFAIGAGIGAGVAAAIPKTRSGLGVSAIAMAGAGIGCFAVYLLTPLAAGTPAAPLTLSALFSTPEGIALTSVFIVTAALAGLYIAPLQAAMQRRAPPSIRARIMAASAFANASFAIPGSLSLLAITMSGADPSLAFIMVGICMLVIAAVMFQRQRTLPEGLHDEVLNG